MFVTTMPDLSNLVTISPLTTTCCSNNSTPVAAGVPDFGDSSSSKELETPFVVQGENNQQTCVASKQSIESKSLDDHLSEWFAKNDKLGFPKSKSFLPFLVGAPKLADCLVCETVIYPGEDIPCGVRDCKAFYHLTCARDWLGLSLSSKKFRCPQHACYLCKKSFHLWRCSRCHLATHDRCAAYPEYVLHSNDHPWQKICWKHYWPPLKPAVPTKSIEDFFCRLPLPYTVKEFMIDFRLKEAEENKLVTLKAPVENKLVTMKAPAENKVVTLEAPVENNLVTLKFKSLVENKLVTLKLKAPVENKLEPPSYVHIRRNIYHVKIKRDDTDRNTGCTDCSSSTCSEDCVCRHQCISCSKACGCSEMCTNKPFRKDKRIKIVLTKHCGWGVEAVESIKKGEFIIEYVGEVISDAMCEQRLWKMKNQGIKNFYMCEVRKDFTIDATDKGNASRFLNHSCGPNCNLEKWDVDGETRVGVFAARSIEVGEPLTYDYRFVQFGPEVKCKCGASCCQGYLGSKKKIPKLGLLDWGTKRRRTATASLTIIRS